MRNQVNLTLLLTLVSLSLFAQPYYIRGAQDPSGPCDWGNTDAACELTETSLGSGVFNVAITPSNGIWKVYDAGADVYYPNGFGNSPWVETGINAIFSFDTNTGIVGVDDGQGYDICAPGEFSSPMWTNTTPMRRNDGMNGSSYCVDVPIAGTYAWKPTACGSWNTFDQGNFYRYADSEAPPAWSVTTSNNDDVICIFYNRNTGNITSSIVTLPVELGHFVGKADGKNIALAWQTYSEVNNDFFTLEKSADGLQFEVLDIIKGAGNSSTRQSYAYVDTRPQSGMNYYRLQQEDYDGGITSSQIVKVEYFDEDKIFVYPNPASERLFVSSSFEGNTSVIVSDLNGRVLMNKALIDDSIDISFLQDGMYTIKLISESQQILLVDKFFKK